MRLDGKVVVITGVSSGMGRATAELFAAEGAKVIGMARRKEMLDTLKKDIEAKGGVFVPYQGDVSIEEQAEGVIDFAVAKFGKLDVAFFNAGLADGNYPIAEVTDELWKKIMGINLDGVFWGTRRAVQIMLDQGYGNIITTASVGGLHGGVAGTAYVTAKHAVIGMTKNIAYYYGRKGIRANAICPGGVRSEIVTKGVGFEHSSQYGNEMQKLGLDTSNGMGEPEDIANLALFLAGEDSKFVNGAALVIDGGWTAY
ncbi:SDR family NAD(P)-dependent oxidoreductase [Aminipila luticellarii]|uniref:SDR family oxidoreductase n=1 Tax=Aminipila luticellarii TaxID=2507160 RepID=A0A410PTJ8_9FIRM|nr:SDR family oxidoreductase [Aminipila luticellarii]QAT42220.1 SDR family oxidoreductase [Aminipila luticellarii]